MTSSLLPPLGVKFLLCGRTWGKVRIATLEERAAVLLRVYEGELLLVIEGKADLLSISEARLSNFLDGQAFSPFSTPLWSSESMELFSEIETHWRKELGTDKHAAFPRAFLAGGLRAQEQFPWFRDARAPQATDNVARSL